MRAAGYLPPDRLVICNGFKPAGIDYANNLVREIYAQLRRRYPSLHVFDFVGGVPVAMTLGFSFDYRGFVRRLLKTLQAVCARYDVPVWYPT